MYGSGTELDIEANYGTSIHKTLIAGTQFMQELRVCVVCNACTHACLCQLVNPSCGSAHVNSLTLHACVLMEICQFHMIPCCQMPDTSSRSQTHYMREGHFKLTRFTSVCACLFAGVPPSISQLAQFSKYISVLVMWCGPVTPMPVAAGDLRCCHPEMAPHQLQILV